MDENKKSKLEDMKFNPLTNLGLGEAYSAIMVEHVKEFLNCKDEDLPELLKSMETTYTDEFIVECVRVAEYLKRKIYK